MSARSRKKGARDRRYVERHHQYHSIHEDMIAGAVFEQMIFRQQMHNDIPLKQQNPLNIQTATAFKRYIEDNYDRMEQFEDELRLGVLSPVLLGQRAQNDDIIEWAMKRHIIHWKEIPLRESSAADIDDQVIKVAAVLNHITLTLMRRYWHDGRMTIRILHYIGDWYNFQSATADHNMNKRYDLTEFRENLRANIDDMFQDDSCPEMVRVYARSMCKEFVEHLTIFVCHQMFFFIIDEERHKTLHLLNDIKRSVNSPEVVKLKEEGNDLFRSGKYIDAIERYTRAINKSPYHHILYTNRATAWLKQAKQEIDRRERFYIKALNDSFRSMMISPQYVKAHLNHARSLGKLNQHMLAYIALEDSLHLIFSEDLELPGNTESELSKIRKDLIKLRDEMGAALHPQLDKQSARNNLTDFINRDHWGNKPARHLEQAPSRNADERKDTRPKSKIGKKPEKSKTNKSADISTQLSVGDLQTGSSKTTATVMKARNESGKKLPSQTSEATNKGNDKTQPVVTRDGSKQRKEPVVKNKSKTESANGVLEASEIKLENDRDRKNSDASSLKSEGSNSMGGSSRISCGSSECLSREVSERHRISELNREIHESLQTASNKLLEKSYISACKTYECVLQQLHDHKQDIKKNTEEVQIIRYSRSTAASRSNYIEDLLSGIDGFKSLMDDSCNTTIKVICIYGFSTALTRIYRHAECIDMLSVGLNLVKKMKHSYYWPGLENRFLIKETNPRIVKISLESLRFSCRAPPTADRICRSHFCTSFGYYHNRIYIDDVSFKGYVEECCSDGCFITYHPGCWKKVESNKKHQSKEGKILRSDCSTPDCSGITIKYSKYDETNNKTYEDKCEAPPVNRLPKPRIKTKLSNLNKISKKSDRVQARQLHRKNKEAERLRELELKKQETKPIIKKDKEECEVAAAEPAQYVLGMKDDAEPQTMSKRKYRSKDMKPGDQAQYRFRESLEDRITDLVENIPEYTGPVIPEYIDGVNTLDLTLNITSLLSEMIIMDGPIHTTSDIIKSVLDEPAAKQLVLLSGGLRSFLLHTHQFDIIDDLVYIKEHRPEPQHEEDDQPAYSYETWSGSWDLNSISNRDSYTNPIDLQEEVTPRSSSHDSLVEDYDDNYHRFKQVITDKINKFDVDATQPDDEINEHAVLNLTPPAITSSSEPSMIGDMMPALTGSQLIPTLPGSELAPTLAGSQPSPTGSSLTPYAFGIPPVAAQNGIKYTAPQYTSYDINSYFPYSTVPMAVDFPYSAGFETLNSYSSPIATNADSYSVLPAIDSQLAPTLTDGHPMEGRPTLFLAESQPTPFLRESQPALSQTERQPTPTLGESQPASTLTESQPMPNLIDSQQTPSLTESQPTPILTEIQLMPTPTDSQPTATLTEIQPTHTLTESQPMPTLTESQPTPTLTESLLAPTLPESLSPPTLTERQLTPILTESQLTLTQTESQPTSTLAESQSMPNPTGSQPMPNLIDNQPTPSLTESQPAPTLTESQAMLTLTESQAMLTLTESQAMLTLTESPSLTLTESPPSLSPTEGPPTLTPTESLPMPFLTEIQSTPNLIDSQPPPNLTKIQPTPTLTESQETLTVTGSQPALTPTDIQPPPIPTDIQPLPIPTEIQPTPTLTDSQPTPILTGSQPTPNLFDIPPVAEQSEIQYTAPLVYDMRSAYWTYSTADYQPYALGFQPPVIPTVNTRYFPSTVDEYEAKHSAQPLAKTSTHLTSPAATNAYSIDKTTESYTTLSITEIKPITHAGGTDTSSEVEQLYTYAPQIEGPDNEISNNVEPSVKPRKGSEAPPTSPVAKTALAQLNPWAGEFQPHWDPVIKTTLADISTQTVRIQYKDTGSNTGLELLTEDEKICLDYTNVTERLTSSQDELYKLKKSTTVSLQSKEDTIKDLNAQIEELKSESRSQIRSHSKEINKLKEEKKSLSSEFRKSQLSTKTEMSSMKESYEKKLTELNQTISSQISVNESLQSELLQTRSRNDDHIQHLVSAQVEVLELRLRINLREVNELIEENEQALQIQSTEFRSGSTSEQLRSSGLELTPDMRDNQVHLRERVRRLNQIKQDQIEIYNAHKQAITSRAVNLSDLPQLDPPHLTDLLRDTGPVVRPRVPVPPPLSRRFSEHRHPSPPPLMPSRLPAPLLQSQTRPSPISQPVENHTPSQSNSPVPQSNSPVPQISNNFSNTTNTSSAQNSNNTLAAVRDGPDEHDNSASGATPVHQQITAQEILRSVIDYVAAEVPERERKDIQSDLMALRTSRGGFDGLKISQLKIMLRNFTQIKVKQSAGNTSVINSQTTAEECVICQDLLLDQSKIHTTTCHHNFHNTCFAQWMLRSKSCPTCRTNQT